MNSATRWHLCVCGLATGLLPCSMFFLPGRMLLVFWFFPPEILLLIYSGWTRTSM